MSDPVKSSGPLSTKDTDLGKSQAIFITVGLAIVLGGLWTLYQGSGPYHPDGPVTRSDTQLLGEP